MASNNTNSSRLDTLRRLFPNMYPSSPDNSNNSHLPILRQLVPRSSPNYINEKYKYMNELRHSDQLGFHEISLLKKNNSLYETQFKTQVSFSNLFETLNNNINNETHIIQITFNFRLKIKFEFIAKRLMNSPQWNTDNYDIQIYLYTPNIYQEKHLKYSVPIVGEQLSSLYDKIYNSYIDSIIYHNFNKFFPRDKWLEVEKFGGYKRRVNRQLRKSRKVRSRRRRHSRRN